MAFKTFKTKREPIALDALARRIAKRRAELGDVEIPRRGGKSGHPELDEGRTPSKRALLKAIEEAGGKW